jgi:tetratricopeptide (TPR) repeat protein
MAPSAQAQIRKAYDALERARAGRDTGAADLSRAYGELGKLLMAAQYPDASEACFLDAQTLDPSDFRWPYYLAHVYRTGGDLARARGSFERALALQPDDVAALVWLGDTYLSVGQIDAAESQFKKALALDDRSLSARFGLGRAALARNDYRRAADYLEEVLKIDPKAAGAHYPLSLAYGGLGDSARAAEHLRLRRERPILPADPLMVELDEILDSPQTYETLGIRALEREDWPSAADYFRKGLALAPESAALRHRLGTALSMMGDQQGAQEQFERVVSTSPDYYLAQYSLGLMLQSKGRHKEAAERFKAAIAERPAYTQARLRLASSLNRLGDAKGALEQYDQAIRAEPDSTEAVLGRAVALAQAGRDDQARRELTTAANAHPDQIVFTHALARLLATAPDDRVRDPVKAMGLVQQLLQKGRTLELGETMAMSLAAEGDFTGAAAVQRDLIKAASGAGLTEAVQRMTSRLALYERREPCRTPWMASEMP